MSTSKIQVLIATMFQSDHSLLERMNIQSDAIVVNQCDYDAIERFQFRGNNILWLSLKERGVGLSRNTALMRATADILLFADEDVILKDNYVELIEKEFQKNKQVDFVCFNIESLNKERQSVITTKQYKLRWYNSLKFGACRLAIKRKSIQRVNVFFSLLFGGGAIYQSGEDSLFILNCLQKKLKGIASPMWLGLVEQKSSTWFNGHDEKYFFDKGVLMKSIFGKKACIVAIVLVLKNKNQCREIGVKKALKSILKGVKKEI